MTQAAIHLCSSVMQLLGPLASVLHEAANRRLILSLHPALVVSCCTQALDLFQEGLLLS